MRILIICSGGMSSTIVQSALEKEAKGREIDVLIKACGSNEVDNELSAESYDIVLVAPQVRHQFATFEQICQKHQVKISLIEPRQYSPLGAKSLLDKIVV